MMRCNRITFGQKKKQSTLFNPTKQIALLLSTVEVAFEIGAIFLSSKYDRFCLQYKIVVETGREYVLIFGRCPIV